MQGYQHGKEKDGLVNVLTRYLENKVFEEIQVNQL